jgi:hypothetical protein
MRKHKVTREDKAEARVAEAIRAGVVLHWSAGHEDGTVGPNRDAVPSAKRQFALHSYKSGYRGQTESRFYETAEQAAYGMLVRTGVTNAIAALKKAAAKRDLRYSNLDTPIPWGRGLRLNSGRSAGLGPMPLRTNVGYDLSYARRIGYPFTVTLAWTEPYLDFPAERVFRVLGRDGRQWGVYASKSEAQTAAQAQNRAVEQGQRLPLLENPRPPRRRTR